MSIPFAIFHVRDVNWPPFFIGRRAAGGRRKSRRDKRTTIEFLVLVGANNGEGQAGSIVCFSISLARCGAAEDAPIKLAFLGSMAFLCGEKDNAREKLKLKMEKANFFFIVKLHGSV